MAGRVVREKGVGPMSSPVNWAVLGLVIERPSYGYELAQRFDRVYGEVLPVSSISHIYAALNALEGRGMVEQLPATPLPSAGGRQPKPHYRATAIGDHGYREWLADQIRADRRRSRLFVRQLSVLANEPQAALEVLRRYEQACLDEAANTPIAPVQSGAPTSDLVARLISEENRLMAQAILTWVEYARHELKALESDEPCRP
jgi:DNA-binding PadR family transcriptional regulator